MEATTTPNTALKTPKDDELQHKDEDCHTLFRIALYYCYVPIACVSDHIVVQKRLCEALDLKGRIRVASEGLNGVLSGLQSNLVCYEELLRDELEASLRVQQQQQQVDEGATIISSEKLLLSSDLDIKFCRLRQDLPVAPQLFRSLSIKATTQVVSLVELEQLQDKSKDMQSNNSQKHKQRRRLKHKPTATLSDEQRRAQEIILQGGCMSAAVLRPRGDADQAEQEVAPQLFPAEWNQKIADLSKDPGNDVILLDCRNMYESNIGCFSAPNTTTLLTNTRKYSELPAVLVNKAERLSKSSHIFSYCTGGVRCERATLFLDKLLDDEQRNKSVSSENSSGGDIGSGKPKIYQLRGGIQRYLESDNTDFFQGKNFVFDPRRTDPNRTDVVIGKCLVCGKKHDDYDNGAAPIESNEARCCKCRILLLVCDGCRSTVVCSGERFDGDKRRLFCGGLEQGCLQIPPAREIQGSALSL